MLRRVATLYISTMALSQAAMATCTFTGSPAAYVNCIYDEVQALQTTVATLQASHQSLQLAHAALQAEHDALEASLALYATQAELSQCLTVDDITLELAAQQGLLSGNLYGLDARYASFEEGDLAQYDLRGDFTGASFRYANLRYTDFYAATLVDASLFYADLTGAQLSYADLSGANLTGANFTDVDVSGPPNFTGAIWLDTTCRDGTNSDDNGGTCCGHMYWAGVACD